MARFIAPYLKRLQVSYGQKLFLLATIPLVLAVAAISVVVADQGRQLAEREISGLETQLIEAKKRELRNYIQLARTAFFAEYGRAAPDDEAAKERVTQILAAMLYGRDGFFFVYHYDGTNLVSPRQTELINRNWTGRTDSNGVPVVDELVRIARAGAGYHTYDWVKPSTGEEARMITYVVGLQDWQWALGTGIFIDDVLTHVAAARAATEARIAQTFFWIGAITLAALLAVFASGLLINIRERRLADAKLKALTQRVLDTQEEERGRVARELHDSISQLLVGIRYALELARRRVQTGDARAQENIEKGIDGLNGAIQEVRRISRDLRPGQLDDLGLGPAIQDLAEEFTKRTGIRAEMKTVVFRNRLDPEAKIALYRIAQEALTNIERHAQATEVHLDLFGHQTGATLRVADNGRGLANVSRGAGGLGLRNMQERVEQLDGTLQVFSSEAGTRIDATVPLSHILPPEPAARSTAAPVRKVRA
ncbi:cache domain-containing protein [Dinoroseobacter sp. PD6]|uniref:cache domain-containing protein n=1 Tax=Dinoroseobacter sp. PD6 TaxID=3028384 RepID=UPI00237C3212|nr:cache domain-containing protein [Dinoroseobacter sp. PD6]MDD9716408.1 cache domain-containing protein [Dinoroseobacter sp. PD6]